MNSGVRRCEPQMARKRCEDVLRRNLAHAYDVVGAAGAPMELPSRIVVAAEAVYASGNDLYSSSRVESQVAGNGSEQAHRRHAEYPGDVQRTRIDADKG